MSGATTEKKNDESTLLSISNDVIRLMTRSRETKTKLSASQRLRSTLMRGDEVISELSRDGRRTGIESHRTSDSKEKRKKNLFVTIQCGGSSGKVTRSLD